MANVYKNTKTLNPALRSIGNMNVRGVMKGGTSAADKAERYALPVMISETGYIDPSLLEGGGGGGGTTEERVKELINENLQPYNDGAEIKADVETKITSATAEVMISNKFQPYTDGQAIKNEVDTKQTAAQVENAIADKFQPYNDGEEIKADIDAKVSKLELPEAIKEQIQQSTEVKTEITNIVSDVLNPYTNGQEIKDEVDEKVNTTDYDADFEVFDSEEGDTKGEKIKNYIDNITPPAPEDVIEKTDMSPYGQTDKTQTGTEIETAIAEKVDYVEFETFESEVGDNIGEKIRSAISGGTTGITESKLSECLSPYSTSSADITEIGTKIKADTDAKIATDDFEAEFATFDTQTGATQGERIKSYIDNHAPSPENAISQQDMSPYGADDKANTGSDIENAINEKVATDDFDDEFAVFDGETGATKGDKIKAYIDEHGGGGDPTAILQANMSPYGQTDKAQTGAEIAAAISSAGYNETEIKEFATEQIATETQTGGVIDLAIDAKISDDLLSKTDLSPYGQTDKTQTGAEIAAAISSAGKTDEEIKALAEEQIETSILEDGAIDEAINAKLVNTISTTDLSPYGQDDKSQTGAEIQSALNLKADASTAVSVSDMSPYGQTTKNTIGAEISQAIEDKILAELEEGGEIAVTVEGITEQVFSTAMSPYSSSVSDINEVGQNIKDDVNTKLNISALQPYNSGTEIQSAIAEKVATDDYDADFNNFEAETGDTKGEKIQNYIDDLADGKVDVTAMSPYTTNPSAIGTAIETAIEAVSRTDDEIKMLAEAQIAEDCEVGGTIDDAINAKIGDDLLETTDLAPYGQDDKTQVGAEIEAALALKADAVDVSGKVDTTTYDADFSNFGINGHSKGENIANYINAANVLKVDITAMAPYADEPSQIGLAIQEAIEAGGGGGISTETFQQYMSPYGATTATTTGEEIQAELDEKLSTETFDSEFEAFGEGADTKGELIKNYIDSIANGKVNVANMEPFIADENIGENIQSAIDEKIDAETLQSYMSPYGQDDISELGNEIRDAITEAGRTDEAIKALAESQITTDIADGGTIDTAIDDKLAAENVLRQSDLSPFGEDDITETGADIQIAINAVDAKTKTDQQIKDLADTQITTQLATDGSIDTAIKSVAVAPTDLGDYYTDDKTQIGANIKAAIESGGDPTNPSVKKSHMSPYGQTDIANTGTDIKADIESSIETALETAFTEKFAPYTNGQEIKQEQQSQNTNFNNKISELDQKLSNDIQQLDSDITELRNDVPIIIEDKFKLRDYKLEEYVDNTKFPGSGIFTSFCYEIVNGQQGILARYNALNNANGYYKCEDKLFFWDYSVYSQTSNKGKMYSYDLTTETASVVINTNVVINSGCYIGGCINDPNVLISVTSSGSTTIYFYLSKDKGETWNRVNYNNIQNVFSSDTLSTFLKDTDGNYIFYNTGYLYKLDIDTLQVQTKNITISGEQITSGNGGVFKNVDNEYYYYMIEQYGGGPYILKANWNYQEITYEEQFFPTFKMADGEFKGQDVVFNESFVFYEELQKGRIYVTVSPYGKYDVILAYHDLDVDVDGDLTSSENPWRFHTIEHYKYVAKDNPNNDRMSLIGIFPSINSAFFWRCKYRNNAYKYSIDRLDLKTNKYEEVLTNITDIAPYLLEVGGTTIPYWYGKYYYENLPKYDDFPVYIMKNPDPYSVDDFSLQYSRLYVEVTEPESLKVGDLLITCRNPGANFLECNGSTFSATNYPLLAKIITDLTLPTGNTSSVITGGTTTFKAYIKAK